MGTEISRGRGKLSLANSEHFVSGINYQIHEELNDEPPRWWGEFTLTNVKNIGENDRYVIELEDGRKGKCSLKRRINRAVILVPPRFIYLVQGTGLLE